jgi:pimeloyl-ACP methyl ester carboxylesterase
MPATRTTSRLAYEEHGAGTPVVLLPGLTFDRRIWGPIMDRIDGSMRAIAIDLPGHGDSPGPFTAFEEIAGQLHGLLRQLKADVPVVVGHSMSGGLASLYAASYPTRGVVVVDNGPDIRPFVRLIQRLEPALRGPTFADVWRTFEDSLGIERIPEPVRSLVLATHRVQQHVVLGYWQAALHTDPDILQELVDAQIRRLDVPYLAVFGRPTTDSERARLGWLQDAQLEQWEGDGHFVHLVDPDRFATRLRHFVDHCTQTTAT